jgi:hypothetical protein
MAEQAGRLLERPARLLMARVVRAGLRREDRQTLPAQTAQTVLRVPLVVEAQMGVQARPTVRLKVPARLEILSEAAAVGCYMLWGENSPQQQAVVAAVDLLALLIRPVASQSVVCTLWLSVLAV